MPGKITKEDTPQGRVLLIVGSYLKFPKFHLSQPMRRTLKLLLTALYHIFIRPCRNSNPNIPFRDQGTLIPLQRVPEENVKILRAGSANSEIIREKAGTTAQIPKKAGHGLCPRRP